MSKTILHEGKFLQLVDKNGWEFVERKNSHGVVGVIAFTTDNNLLLVEQHRIPLCMDTIELPAGLIDRKEIPICAAVRELREETGYAAENAVYLFEGSSSTGLTSETIDIFLATECRKISEGGGIPEEGEKIIVHPVSFEEIDSFLENQEKDGKMIDLKVRMTVAMWKANGGNGIPKPNRWTGSLEVEHA